MESFINLIIKEINKGLPGVEAQYKMAPIKRIQPDENYYLKKQAAPKSSVLVLLYPKNNAVHVVLIERPIYKGAHSGQISFPGGKVDKNDLNPMHTAIRETFEEIGIQISEKNILTELTSLYIPASNFEVFPFLAWINETPTFIPNKREVAAILETPISLLLNDNTVNKFKVSVNGELNQNVPCFKIYDNIVWGATAMILSELKEIIKKSGAEFNI
jgi:8-oxo-dGTP pyrophosphatase MutT (NUDIX family)